MIWGYYMASSGRSEFGEYVATGVGMALACSGYAMVGQLSLVVDGSALLVAVVLAFVLCMVIAGSIGELAGMYPSAPGVRTYLKAAFGEDIRTIEAVALMTDADDSDNEAVAYYGDIWLSSD